jgi:hypothetical protein
MKATEQCGFCGGNGRVPGCHFDRDGRFRPEWPDTIVCEYCGGSGQCEEGSKLLSARPTCSDEELRQAREEHTRIYG